jgi:hypothetical protein
MSMTMPPPVSPRQPRSGASGCLAAFLALLGVLMVLPGLCSFAVLLMAIGDGQVFRDGGFMVLWIITFLVAAGGVMLARYALKMERTARQKDDPG